MSTVLQAKKHNDTARYLITFVLLSLALTSVGSPTMSVCHVWKAAEAKPAGVRSGCRDCGFLSSTYLELRAAGKIKFVV